MTMDAERFSGCWMDGFYHGSQLVLLTRNTQVSVVLISSIKSCK